MALARPLAHPYDRQILRLAVPALGALAAEPLYVLADTAVVGRLGTSQLGGLAVASTLILTGYALFNFLAYGTTASVARRLGSGDAAGAAHEGVQGMWLALAIGLALALVGLALAPQAVALMGGTGEVADNALVYLRISLAGVPALLLTLAGTGYLRGRQDTVTPLIVTGVAVGANLAIELVLIYGLGYGIGASALATVVAQVGAAGAYGWWVARDVAAQGVGWRPDAAAIRRLAVVGRDLFVRTAALRLALTLTTAVAAPARDRRPRSPPDRLRGVVVPGPGARLPRHRRPGHDRPPARRRRRRRRSRGRPADAGLGGGRRCGPRRRRGRRPAGPPPTVQRRPRRGRPVRLRAAVRRRAPAAQRRGVRARRRAHRRR